MYTPVKSSLPSTTSQSSLPPPLFFKLWFLDLSVRCWPRGAVSLLLCFMSKALSLEKLKIPLTVCLHFAYLANGQMTTLGGNLLAGQPYLRETDCIRSFFLISEGERFQAQKTIEAMVCPACSGDQTLCPPLSSGFLSPTGAWSQVILCGGVCPV